MRNRTGPFYLSLAAGFVILAIDIYGFMLLRSRPAIPKEHKLATIVRLDGAEIRDGQEIHFHLIRKAVGDRITLVLRDKGTERTVQTTVVPYYNLAPYLISYLIVGLFAAAVGAVCFILRYEDLKARIFYWTSLAFASPVILGGSVRLAKEEWPSLVPGVLFCVSYAFVIPLLLLFLMEFSRRRYRLVKTLAFLSAAFFGLTLSGSFLSAALLDSVAIYRSVHLPLYTVFRVFTVVVMFLTIFYLLSPFRSTRPSELREPFKWIILGLLLSYVPYSALYQIPSIIDPGRPLVKDEVATLFFVFAPIAFALAIFKFKLIRLELVIRRSLVYSLLTAFTVGLYVFIVQVLQPIFLNLLPVKTWLFRAAAVLLAAAAFSPAQGRIQNLVDRAFFRRAYDYRQCLKSFIAEANAIADREVLCDHFLTSLDRALPLERRGLCVHAAHGGNGPPYLAGGDLGGLEETESPCLDADRILATKRTPFLEGADYSREPLLESAGWEMIFPLTFKAAAMKGVLGFGPKKSGQPFSREDAELLASLAGELATHLERIKLHEEVVEERTSREKLDELNRLKTEFIATFSHELRTPMSSIQGLAEILGSGKIRDKARREELLRTIAAESGRLSRMVHNVLDFGKIEHEAKTFCFRKTDIRHVLGEAIEVFRPQLEAGGFATEVDVPGHPILLEADPDAVKQALINCIDNAIHYASDKKEVGLRLIERAGKVEIQVRDRGIGIPEGDRDKIFEAFYRAPDATGLNPKGVGLGLKIVRFIMENHKGEVLVDSRPGGGSTFRLVFPKP